MSTTNRHAELMTQLAEGIAGLTSSDQWLRHLDCQSRFHRYSFGNAVLIAAQRPQASRVAGFRTWKKFGRSVRKGETAIWILAPMAGKPSKQSATDEERVIHGFKYVPVFDVAQTEGEELPVVCQRLSGEEPAAFFARLTEVAEVLGYIVEDAHLADGVNGDCAFRLRRIRVEVGNSPAQRVKTLAHEIAHAVLHAHEQNRLIAELEAESTAYVICRHLGLDTGAYTFGYVATWAGGGPEAITAIKASCTNIQRTTQLVLELLEFENRSDLFAAA